MVRTQLQGRGFRVKLPAGSRAVHREPIGTWALPGGATLAVSVLRDEESAPSSSRTLSVRSGRTSGTQVHSLRLREGRTCAVATLTCPEWEGDMAAAVLESFLLEAGELDGAPAPVAPAHDETAPLEEAPPTKRARPLFSRDKRRQALAKKLAPLKRGAGCSFCGGERVQVKEPVVQSIFTTILANVLLNLLLLPFGASACALPQDRFRCVECGKVD